MPKVTFSQRFIRHYAKLPKSIRDKVDRQIRLLADNPRHPSLQTKPIQGSPGIYEARVYINYRMTYERLPSDVLLVRVVGLHDDTLKNP
jgi:mRNA-degrading endonuclease RelE of RelBE toxin-antitoxin system